MEKNIPKKPLRKKNEKKNDLVPVDYFIKESTQNIQKTKEEVLKPYIQTIIVAIITTILFIYFLSKNEKGTTLEQSQEEVSTKKYDSKTNSVDESDLKTETPDKHDDKTETENPDVSNENTIQIRNEEQIKLTISETINYLKANKYNNKTNDELLTKLNSLFKIRGLSDAQNDQLSYFIIEVEKIKRKNVKKDKIGAVLHHDLKYTVIKTHIVREHETLSQISEKYKIQLNTLIKLNPKRVDENMNIKIGDTLRLE